MTVLQKIIEDFVQQYNDDHNVDAKISFRAVIILLRTNLPAEQQQIRDTWKAAESRFRYAPSGGNHPDLETYLTHLQTK